MADRQHSVGTTWHFPRLYRSVVLPLQWCLQRNNRILELTPGEFICFDLRFTRLLPRVRTAPPKCFCANSSESHRRICSRYAIIIDFKWTRHWSESVSHQSVSTIFIHRDCKQLYTWKGNFKLLGDWNQYSISQSFFPCANSERIYNTWTMHMFYFEIHGSAVFIWIICHFITTFALFPSGSTNWRGYAFLSHLSDQFVYNIYWCSNSILKIKCSMKVCFDQALASSTREILYVPTWQINDRWRDFGMWVADRYTGFLCKRSLPFSPAQPPSSTFLYPLSPPPPPALLPIPFALATQARDNLTLACLLCDNWPVSAPYSQLPLITMTIDSFLQHEPRIDVKYS